jgi:hypothetical protein
MPFIHYEWVGGGIMPFTNPTPKVEWVVHPIVFRSNQGWGSSVIALLWKESGKDEDAVLKKQLPVKRSQVRFLFLPPNRS